ncbi:unnamed protein product, partial [Musa textilis]
ARRRRRHGEVLRARGGDVCNPSTIDPLPPLPRPEPSQRIPPPPQAPPSRRHPVPRQPPHPLRPHHRRYRAPPQRPRVGEGPFPLHCWRPARGGPARVGGLHGCRGLHQRRGTVQRLPPHLAALPQDRRRPRGRFLTSEELAEWNLKQSEKEVMHRTRRDMKLHDKNRDGFISFQEYEPPSWVRRLIDNKTDDKFGWWKEDHFNASDMDGDSLLNLTEFNDFLHPADTSNPKLIEWLCQEEIRERDTDKDGKLNFEEYLTGLFHLIRNYDEVYSSTHETDTSNEIPAKKLFAQLDLDNNGFLSADELKPVIHDLHPSEHYYAKQQAAYVLSQVWLLNALD